MFMPLYFPKKQAPRVVVVGGGYAGLSALVTLREHRPDADITLIDPRDHHLKITHLHETFRRPLSSMCLSFRLLEQRFDIRHVRAGLAYEPTVLQQWATEGWLSADGQGVEFDYLIWATGAGQRALEKSPQVLDLSDFMQTPGADMLRQKLGECGSAEPIISVVGSGATGIQFLFEIDQYIRDHGLPWRLRLVDAGDAPLRQFNPKLGRYVVSRLEDLGIEYLPNHHYRGQREDHIELENHDTGALTRHPSCLSLVFAGMSPESRLETNVFGQVLLAGKTQPKVFAAGDCSVFKLPGSNALSAQTALRKGRLVARNVLRHGSQFKLLEPWVHRDLGYVIGMGPQDAVGWVALEGNIIAGRPAVLLKEVVEAQYDLLLAGLDTYLL